MLSCRSGYVFAYNLLQFCGHSWTLCNILARILRFGRDALADTFYSVGVAASLCQLFSVLELYHIADGVENARLLPRFIQVAERSCVLVLVLVLEEVRTEPVVSLLFFLWDLAELLRYPHELLSVAGAPSATASWLRYTLRIPVCFLSAIVGGVTLFQALPDAGPLQLSWLLKLLLALCPVGASVSIWQLLKEREQWLSKRKKMRKRR